MNMRKKRELAFIIRDRNGDVSEEVIEVRVPKDQTKCEKDKVP